MSKYADIKIDGIEWIESIEQWDVSILIGGKLEHIGFFNDLGDELGEAVVDRAKRAAAKETDVSKAKSITRLATKWLMDLGVAQLRAEALQVDGQSKKH